jgi:hypothetical protein
VSVVSEKSILDSNTFNVNVNVIQIVTGILHSIVSLPDFAMSNQALSGIIRVILGNISPEITLIWKRMEIDGFQSFCFEALHQNHLYNHWWIFFKSFLQNKPVIKSILFFLKI